MSVKHTDDIPAACTYAYVAFSKHLCVLIRTCWVNGTTTVYEKLRLQFD